MAIEDEDIDTSDIPEATEADFRRARIVRVARAAPDKAASVIPTVSMTYARTGASTKTSQWPRSVGSASSVR